MIFLNEKVSEVTLQWEKKGEKKKKDEERNTRKQTFMIRKHVVQRCQIWGMGDISEVFFAIMLSFVSLVHTKIPLKLSSEIGVVHYIPLIIFSSL